MLSLIPELIVQIKIHAGMSDLS